MNSVHALAQTAGQPQGGRRRRLGKEEERRVLARAINEMSEIERLVLGLRCLEAVRPRQIAAMLDLTEEKVQSLVEDGMRLIQSHLLEARNGGGLAAAAASSHPGNGRNGGRQH